jgi:cytochrome c553
MFGWRLPPLKSIAIWCGATVAVLAVGGVLFAASGLYNIAASRDHFALVAWFLEFAMRRSVATHSWPITAPPLHDSDLVRLGAGHFHGGCVPCHGAPGEARNPIVASMLPSPPDLAHAVSIWSDVELFWIVKHGLKYTGMPAWVAQRRDDEVWAVVAFLRELPNLDAAQYRALANGNAAPEQRTVQELVQFGSARESISVCARCHGEESASTTSRLIPRLAGQSARYLESALRQYAEGLRASGIMQPVAAKLDAEMIGRLSQYYAGLPARREDPPAVMVSGEQIERGRTIAIAGVPASGIPPCLVCHGGTSAATFPKLAGQHAPYIAGQLRLFREGVRAVTTHAAIMAPIARRLTEQQIADVAAYLERLTPGTVPRGNVTGAAEALP